MRPTADTSVVVPAIASWHDEHARAEKALRAVAQLPAHVIVESVSVLSRLPGGRALPVAGAVRLVRARIPDGALLLDGAALDDFLGLLAERGISGGRVYDALVGYTARRAGCALLSFDARASATYAAIGVDLARVA